MDIPKALIDNYRDNCDISVDNAKALVMQLIAKKQKILFNQGTHKTHDELIFKMCSEMAIDYKNAKEEEKVNYEDVTYEGI